LLSATDKIYWVRVVLGAATGTLAATVAGNDYMTGILFALVVFLASYYAFRFVWGANFSKGEQGKIYTTGIGSYVMLFLFFWLFLFTIGVHYVTLVVAA
jgi:hypothetical protein